MHVRFGSGVIAVVLAAGIGDAHAQTTDWATCPTTLPACSSTVKTCCTQNFAEASGYKPIIIPMDRCHQQFANNGAPGSGPPGSADAQGWCSDPNTYNEHGMFYAYGLVYRLMQNNIPVYWIVNPTKTASSVADYQTDNREINSPTDIDAWILSSGANPPKAPNASDALDELTACASGCTPPVLRLNSALNAVAGSYTKQEFPLRGSAWLIAAEDRANFEKFWNRQSPYPALSGRGCGQSGNDCYDFDEVTLYEVQTGSHYAYQDFTAALSGGYYTKTDGVLPVAVKIDYKPPRVARYGTVSAVATGWLKAANLDDPATNTSCGTAAFSPSDAVYCNVSEADLLDNKLVSGGFSWVWMDSKAFTNCGPAMTKIKAFLTSVPATWNAGHVMFNDLSLEGTEECANHQLLGQQGATTGSLDLDGGQQKDDESSPLIIRHPTNLFVQWGDIPINFVASSVTNWRTTGSRAYDSVFTSGASTMKRLVTKEATGGASNRICGDSNTDNDLGTNNTPDSGELPHSTASSPAGCDSADDDIDLATYGRHQNNGMNGLVFYTGGNQISTSAGQLRLILNALIATPSGGVQYTPTSTDEITRSAPVVATVDGVPALVQGTYLYHQPVSSPLQATNDVELNTFQFPYKQGHLRAIATDVSLATTYEDSASNATVLFDAANGIPSTTGSYTGACTPKTSGCRTIYTTVDKGAAGDGRNPTLTPFNQAYSSTIGPLLTSHPRVNLSTTGQQTLMQRVIAGVYDSASSSWVARLGGIDRSTAAVIESSSVAGTTRPTMAYFGAADGMLHAVCASILPPCTSLGQELWAYIPRTLLPYLALNVQRIDGSPRVIDAFIDHDGNGTRQWRTVLMFQTGMGDKSLQTGLPAAYALDVTDPTNPSVIWELSQDSTQGTFEQGIGLTIAAGPVIINAKTKYVAWVQTNNGGSGVPGTVVQAVNIEDLSSIWTTQFEHAYIDPPRAVSADEVVIDSAVPGGAVALDKAGSGYITDIVFADIYGSLWSLDSETGTSNYGTSTPLFRVGGNFRPIGAKPAIYSTGGVQYAVFGTGGYSDTADTSWPMECAKSGAIFVCAQFNNSTFALPTQYLVSVNLSTPVGSAPLNEGSVTYVKKTNLGANQKVYSQPLVVGDDIFLSTDVENVNRGAYATSGTNTGYLHTLSASGAWGASSTGIVIASGASAAANQGANVFTGTGQNLNYRGAANGTGTSVDPSIATKVSRKLWLRTE